MKLVSLALAGAKIDYPYQIPLPLSFRDMAVWCPDVPQSGFSYLDGPVTSKLCTESVVALAHLAAVTRITVRLRTNARGGFLAEPASLSLRFVSGQSEETSVLSVGTDDPSLWEEHHMDIDGEGGEHITGLDKVLRVGNLMGFRVSLVEASPQPLGTSTNVL